MLKILTVRPLETSTIFLCECLWELFESSFPLNFYTLKLFARAVHVNIEWLGCIFELSLTSLRHLYSVK